MVGVHGNGTRRRKFASVSRHRMKMKRVHKTARARNDNIQGEIAYPELATPGVIKKRKNNPRSNVTISGKKKNKILKQIRHMERDKSQMQVEETVAAKKKGEPREIEMAEVKPKKTKKHLVEETVAAKKKGGPREIEMAEVKPKKTKKQSHRKNQMDVDEET